MMYNLETFRLYNEKKNKKQKTKKQKTNLCWPGIEPGSTDWKAGMLTTLPPMQTSSFI